MTDWTYVGEAASLRRLAMEIVKGYETGHSIHDLMMELKDLVYPQRQQEERWSWTADYYDKGEK